MVLVSIFYGLLPFETSPAPLSTSSNQKIKCFCLTKYLAYFLIQIFACKYMTYPLHILQHIYTQFISNLTKLFFQFEGVKIAIDGKVGIFITMNPGYAGRTELPESVKALFRPVMCIMPDKELICLISLFSDGFLTAKVIFTVCKMCFKPPQLIKIKNIK